MDTRRILIALTIVLLAAIAPLAGRISPALAATVTVSSCDQAVLSAAIAAAGDGGTVSFGSDCSLSVTSTIGVSTTLTIDGGSHAVTLDGGGSVQLFYVAGAGNLTLSHLTLAHGASVDGGAVDNQGGTVTVENSTISGNTAASEGGGVFNTGSLTVENSTISGNTGLFDAGGIANVGVATVRNSTISNNSTSPDPDFYAKGGGVLSAGYGVASLTVQNSVISGNTAYVGGGLYAGPATTLTVENSTISGNTAADHGGGVDNSGATLTVQNSTISGNATTLLASSFSGGAGPYLPGEGGGIYAEEGIYRSPSTTVENSTISGNSAPGDNGGGIANIAGVLTVRNSTVAGNSAFGGGGVQNNSLDPTSSIANSIFSNNRAFDGGLENCGGFIPDGGYNLEDFYSADCTFSVANHDIVGQDPKLGALADNGGPTQTMALGPGSPAIGAGNPSLCQAAGIDNLDQRGDPRHADTRGACDIGAYDTGTIPLANQTITFTPLPNRTYGDASFDVSSSASASSGLPVSFSSSTPSVCSTSGLTGSTISILAAGTCTISASQTGNTAYNPAPTVQQSFAVAKAALTITANNKSMAYGGTVPSFDAGESGFKNQDTSSVVGGLACSSADAGGHPISSSTPPGSYPITCSGATAANYSISYQPGILTIQKGMLVVTADNKQMTYGAGSLPALTATESGFVNGDTGSVLSGSLSCVAKDATGTAIAATAPAGAYTIDCSSSSLSAANYSIAYNSGTLTVNKATLTVTTNNKSMTYGGTMPAFDAAYSGFVNGDTASVLSGSPACSSATPASSPAGTYTNTITCTAGTLSAPNYSFAFQPGTLTITPAPLTITADNQSKVYGAALPTFTAHDNGLVNGDTSSVVSGLTFSTPATASSAVGSYAITPSGATASNYTIRYLPGTLTVTPAALTITADNQHMLLHGTVPSLTTHLSGLVNGDSAASLAPGPSCGTTGTSSSAVGSYPITCSGAVDPNYTLSYVGGSLTITYKWSGFGQPINDPAAGSTPMSVFKAGSTIPVKFQLKDANGVVVQAGSAPTFSVSQPQACSAGAVDEAASTVTGDTGTTYRWDSSAQQYIYNDKTTSALSGMCQFIQATLDDGTTQSVYVGYK